MSLVVAYKKGTDQPVHPRSLISKFVNRSLESIIFRCPTSVNLIFYQVSVAESHFVGNTEDRVSRVATQL